MPQSAPSRRSPLVVLFLTVFIDLMGFGIVIPLLPIYAREMHASDFAAGALVGVYSLMQLLFAPVWGRISDRIGRRPVLLASLSASVASYLMLAGAGSLAMLFAARLLAGVAGATISVAQAYIADVTAGGERARGMGLVGAAFALGMVMGPAIGGGLSLVGPRAPELFAAALCFVNVVMAAYRLPESLPVGTRRAAKFRHPLSLSALREAVGRPGAPSLLAIFFLVMLAFADLEGNFSYAAHGHDFTPSQVASLWVYMGLVAAVVQGWLVGKLVRRTSERTVVVVGTLALGVGFCWMPFVFDVGSLGMLAALGLVIGGQGLASPALSSLISKTATSSNQGEVLGLSQSLSAGARFLGPTAGGLLQGRFGTNGYFGAALCAAGAFGLASLAQRAATSEREAEALPLRRSG